MRKHEIPRDEWSEFFYRFITTHIGRSCALVVTTRDENRSIRLHPVLLTAVGPDIGDLDPRVRVLLTDLHGDQIGYSIVGPRHVFLKRTDAGVDETLEIEGAESKTTMRFQAAS